MPHGRQQAASGSHAGAVSRNGRYLALRSASANIAAGDTNELADVFVLDRTTRRIERVNVGPRGDQANGPTFRPSLSADGRFVAFRSLASNLVRGDTNRSYDVFVRDRSLGSTKRVSLGPGRRQVQAHMSRPFLSGDGRFVAYRSAAAGLVAGDTNGFPDVFLFDRLTGRTIRVSISTTGRQANGLSLRPAVGTDGRLVAFASAATNLVPRDRNGVVDVFVRAPRWVE